MSLTILRGPEQAPLQPLLERTVAVIGFGNQGSAHALNLRDSGVRVLVGNRRDSESGRLAVAAGFEPLPIKEAVSHADLVILAVPDEAHGEVYTRQIQPNIKANATLGLLHGLSIRFGLLRPTKGVGVIMVAPKGPGATLRERYRSELGIPCLFALHQDSASHDAEAIGLAWANGIGCARAAIIKTTFADEAETDLFGEQAVLCGGMTWLMLAAYETLVEAGYPPELAYLECCHEVKQVADLVYERGIAAMMHAISNTAEFGAHAAGPRVIDDDVRAKLRAILDDVRNGSFASQLETDHAAGFAWLAARRKMLSSHPVEQAGAVIRNLMPRRDQAGESSA